MVNSLNTTGEHEDPSEEKKTEALASAEIENIRSVVHLVATQQDATAIYGAIEALGKESVWVPGVNNGAMKILVKVLLKRGWTIAPSTASVSAQLQDADAVHSALIAETAVWVPGVENGAMKAFVKELINRGWTISSPQA